MKTAVITGTTSGIGENILKLFLQNGYTVWAGYRDVKQRKFLSAISNEVIPFRIDLSKKWTIREAVKIIDQSAEKIDVLVNVAGKVVAGPLETLSVDKIREQFEVNTFGQLELAQGLFKKLDGGKIINISSMASYGLFPFIAPYCASKRALDMLFNSLMIETGAKVKIISVKPGVISTPLWQKAVEENKENIGEDKYKVVGDFLKSNAKKNLSQGLNPEVVANKVLKIANSDNPARSYTIGFDAYIAKMISKLPQKLIDSIVEKRLFNKINAYVNNGYSNESDNIEEDKFKTDNDSDLIDTIFNVNKSSESDENENIEEEAINISENASEKFESALDKAIEYNKS